MKRKTKETRTRLTRYEADVMRSVKTNHIWLNAFACIRPSDEFVLMVGRYVLGLLNEPENLILSDCDESEVLRALKMKELVVRINKS
ncbi:MAG: hypothetical protein GX575_25345 [Candidatus Anammoximicrobium sp.]|nr:hypothetical protein [Candidatus Anammoximicrobium sp.]